MEKTDTMTCARRTTRVTGRLIELLTTDTQPAEGNVHVFGEETHGIVQTTDGTSRIDVAGQHYIGDPIEHVKTALAEEKTRGFVVQSELVRSYLEKEGTFHPPNGVPFGTYEHAGRTYEVH